MSSKVKSMSEAVRLVQDGQLLAVGGNALHRTPAAFCHELAKLGRKGLKDCGAARDMPWMYAADSKFLETIK